MGSCFNVSITFANISVMIPIVHISIVGLYYHLKSIRISIVTSVNGEEFYRKKKL